MAATKINNSSGSPKKIFTQSVASEEINELTSIVLNESSDIQIITKKLKSIISLEPIEPKKQYYRFELITWQLINRLVASKEISSTTGPNPEATTEASTEVNIHDFEWVNSFIRKKLFFHIQIKEWLEEIYEKKPGNIEFNCLRKGQLLSLVEHYRNSNEYLKAVCLYGNILNHSIHNGNVSDMVEDYGNINRHIYLLCCNNYSLDKSVPVSDRFIYAFYSNNLSVLLDYLDSLDNSDFNDYLYIYTCFFIQQEINKNSSEYSDLISFSFSELYDRLEKKFLSESQSLFRQLHKGLLLGSLDFFYSNYFLLLQQQTFALKDFSLSTEAYFDEYYLFNVFLTNILLVTKEHFFSNSKENIKLYSDFVSEFCFHLSYLNKPLMLFIYANKIEEFDRQAKVLAEYLCNLCNSSKDLPDHIIHSTSMLALDYYSSEEVLYILMCFLRAMVKRFNSFPVKGYSLEIASEASSGTNVDDQSIINSCRMLLLLSEIPAFSESRSIYYKLMEMFLIYANKCMRYLLLNGNGREFMKLYEIMKDLDFRSSVTNKFDNFLRELIEYGLFYQVLKSRNAGSFYAKDYIITLRKCIFCYEDLPLTWMEQNPNYDMKLENEYDDYELRLNEIDKIRKIWIRILLQEIVDCLCDSCDPEVREWKEWKSIVFQIIEKSGNEEAELWKVYENDIGDLLRLVTKCLIELEERKKQ